MMAVGRLEKRIDIGAAEKTRGVQQGWKWRKKTDRQRRAIEGNNYDREGGRQIFRDDGDGGVR